MTILLSYFFKLFKDKLLYNNFRAIFDLIYKTYINHFIISNYLISH